MHNLFSLVRELTGHEADLFSKQVIGENRTRTSKMLLLFEFTRKAEHAPSLHRASQAIYGKMAINTLVKLKGRLMDALVLFISQERRQHKKSQRANDLADLLRKVPLLLQVDSSHHTVKLKADLLTNLVNECIKMEMFGLAADLDNQFNREKTLIHESTFRKSMDLFDLIQSFKEVLNGMETGSGVLGLPATGRSVPKIKKSTADEAEGGLLGFYRAILSIVHKFYAGKKISSYEQKKLLKHLGTIKSPDLSLSLETYFILTFITLSQHQEKNSVELNKKAFYIIDETGCPKLVQRQCRMLFHHKMYNGDFESAHLVVNQLIGLDKENNHTNELYLYWDAWCHFLKGNYKQAFSLLTRLVIPLEWDKGWEVCRKILLSLCCIELMVMDLAYVNMNSLKRSLNRNKESISLRKRYSILLDLSNFLIKMNGLSGVVLRKNRDTLHLFTEKLATSTREYAWQPVGAEVFPLHYWIEMKFAKNSAGWTHKAERETCYAPAKTNAAKSKSTFKQTPTAFQPGKFY